MVAVPSTELAGVKVTPVPEATPDVAFKVPFADGLTEKFTVFAKAPVPVTVGVHVAVCVTRMDDGLHRSETAVIAGGAAVTVILAEPVMLVYPACAECAMQVAVPAVVGVNTPAVVIVPPVAVQVTAEL